MTKHVLVVRSNPVTGRDDEYNDWYSHRHLQDVLKVPGFLSAQRFTLAQADPDARWKYLAIYEFEGENAAEVLGELFRRVDTAQMVLSEAMDLQDYSVTPWVALTEKLVANG